MLTQLRGLRTSFTSSTLITAGRRFRQAVGARAGHGQDHVFQRPALRGDLADPDPGRHQPGVDGRRVRVRHQQPLRITALDLAVEHRQRAVRVGGTDDRAAGRRPQLFKIVLFDQPPPVHDAHPGAQLLDLAQLVAGQEHRRAGRVELGEQVADLVDALRVQAVGRLVQDEQPGGAQQRGGQPEPLAHAQRVPLDGAIVDTGQPGPLQSGGDPAAAGAAAAGLPGRVDEGEVGAPGQVAIRGRAFHQRADGGQHLGHPLRHRLAQDGDLAARRVDQPEQHPDDGRLAGAVRPQEAVPVAFPHVQIEPVHDEQVAVALGECPRDDHGWPPGR